MIIDLHCHLAPGVMTANRPANLFDVEGYLEKQRESGIDISVVSNPMLGSLPWVDIRTLDHLKKSNEFLAELTQRYPENLLAVASTVPVGGDAYLAETVRAIKEYGLKGVVVNSSYDGEYLDSPRAFPFYEVMQELDLPILIHPPGIMMGVERMFQYRLVEMIGRPMDTTFSLTRMIFAGVLEKFPRLKFVCAHLGGAITILAGRLDYGYETRADEGFGPWGPEDMTRKPSEYIKKLYVDTVSFHPPGIKCALETVGEDHVVLGTDNPPVAMPLQLSLVMIRDLPVPGSTVEKILGGNAKSLLHID